MNVLRKHSLRIEEASIERYAEPHHFSVVVQVPVEHGSDNGSLAYNDAASDFSSDALSSPMAQPPISIRRNGKSIQNTNALGFEGIEQLSERSVLAANAGHIRHPDLSEIKR
jgi:hypothetical protein